MVISCSHCHLGVSLTGRQWQLPICLKSSEGFCNIFSHSLPSVFLSAISVWFWTGLAGASVNPKWDVFFFFFCWPYSGKWTLSCTFIVLCHFHPRPQRHFFLKWLRLPGAFRPVEQDWQLPSSLTCSCHLFSIVHYCCQWPEMKRKYLYRTNV